MVVICSAREWNVQLWLRLPALSEDKFMNTPVCDFTRKYAQSDSLRLHMPGHKGKNLIGIESIDITEISGADSLYEADSIIKESEENASRLFGCRTYYSTEGSSLCIRAMLYLLVLYAKSKSEKPLILAGRNAHRTFISAAALLDFDVEWLYPSADDSYLSCNITPDVLDKTLSSMAEKPIAVYLTNPDYLGNCIDIKSISAVCKKHGVLLAVDNAHGAYLKFLPESLHPIDLGADICCDSAHKTLPVLTGGAYLHISDNLPDFFAGYAKNAMAMFGSTSPSYVIMQSLDAANKYICDGYREKLLAFASEVRLLKNKLISYGYSFVGDEPLKLTFDVKKYGYKGCEFSQILNKNNIECEFSDPDFVVLMMTPENGEDDLRILKDVLLSVEKKAVITEKPPLFSKPKKAISIREASLSVGEKVPVSQSLGRVLAVSDVSCPPAVPIAVSGEIIDEHSVSCFEYYGTEYCTVII